MQDVSKDPDKPIVHFPANEKHKLTAEEIKQRIIEAAAERSRRDSRTETIDDLVEIGGR